MASVGFGVVKAVAPTLGAVNGRRQRRPACVQASTKSSGAAAAKEEKGLLDFIVGAIYKEEQMLETDPLLNKVDDKLAGGTSGTVSRKASGTAVGKKDSDSSGGGFNFGGFFAKKG